MTAIQETGLAYLEPLSKEISFPSELEPQYTITPFLPESPILPDHNALPLYVQYQNGEAPKENNQNAQFWAGLVKTVNQRMNNILNIESHLRETPQHQNYKNGLIEIVEVADSFYEIRHNLHLTLVSNMKHGDPIVSAIPKYGAIRLAEQLGSVNVTEKLFPVDIRGCDGTTSGEAAVRSKIPENLLEPNNFVYWVDDVLDTARSLGTFVGERYKARSGSQEHLDEINQMIITLGDGFEKGFDALQSKKAYQKLAILMSQQKVVMAAEISKNPFLLAAIRQRVQEVEYDDNIDLEQWARLQREVIGDNPNTCLILETSGWLMGVGTLDTKISGAQTAQERAEKEKITLSETLAQIAANTPDAHIAKHYVKSAIRLAKEKRIDGYTFRLGAGKDLPLIKMADGKGAYDLAVLAALVLTQHVAVEQNMDPLEIQEAFWKYGYHPLKPAAIAA